MTDATLKEDNIIFNRKWVSYGTRYGEVEDILEEVFDEIDALYPEDRLDSLVNEAKNKRPPEPKVYRKVSLETFKNELDWKKRLFYLDHYDTPTKEDYPLLDYALSDEKIQVRRMSVSLLAMIEDKETLEYLKKATLDRSIPVRRTAGDAYSDLGYEEGLKDIYPLLKDKSPIVRWRAAMFIYEVGNEKSLPYLIEVRNDEKYDVRLQVELAISRIENGEAALGSVWKQMEERNL
ncbi:virulence factor [Phocicoccus pinnipedialis]|uniref:Virulence factor domain-containing protein n=1 Tax=Phocicoccus pinnipedialis TaxID=110845 RepID=A0A6V7REE6_9BACL|nr:HEAT repeat protein [Jeotgalicoccus pinnipedialis]CAD2075522.1 hypothetical protein JEOPIN946_01041 [Jeotgalicoccus pinnipedialis]